MKTKEEIEQLADNFYPLVTTDLICSPKLVRDGYFKGYTQCQEDMAEKYTEEDIYMALEFGRSHSSMTDKQFIESLNKQD